MSSQKKTLGPAPNALAAHLGTAPGSITPLALDLVGDVSLADASAQIQGIQAQYAAIIALCTELNTGDYLQVALSISDNAGANPTRLDCVLSTQSLQVLGYLVGTDYWEMTDSNYATMAHPDKISRANLKTSQALILSGNQTELSGDNGQAAACLMIFCVSEAAREKTAQSAILSAMFPYHYQNVVNQMLSAQGLQRAEPYHTLQALSSYANHSCIMKNWDKIVAHRAALAAAVQHPSQPITLADARSYHQAHGTPSDLQTLDALDIHHL